MKLFGLLLIGFLFTGATTFTEVKGVKGSEYNLIMPVVKEEIRYGNVSLDFIKEKLGQRESRGDYHVTNQIGCLGKYQFTVSTLKGLGYTKKEIKAFILCYKEAVPTISKPAVYTYSTDMQEEAMDKLLKANYEWLKHNKLLKYNNKTIGGIHITIEGMLAACHLLGGMAVKDYLQSGGDMTQYHKTLKNGKTLFIRKYDGNGTSIKEYLNLIR